MDRYRFNQELQGAVRHLLQCGERESDARSLVVALRAEPEECERDILPRAELALEATGKNLDAAIMEFTDRLFDAIYLPRAESIQEAARLEVSA